jgi:predicted DCC family thiol-disulfide oxidoreductase YuxK
MMATAMQTPELIYDGECDICKDWVVRWQRLTGAQVRYRPFQHAASDHPHITSEEFHRSIQFIDTDGKTYNGAAAVFRLLRLAPAHGWEWWLYCYVPGFAWCSERVYRFLAQRRSLLRRLSRWLWRRDETD